MSSSNFSLPQSESVIANNKSLQLSTAAQSYASKIVSRGESSTVLHEKEDDSCRKRCHHCDGQGYFN
eukprot:11159469-Ditylum_brightwellii.AAC.1